MKKFVRSLFVNTLVLLVLCSVALGADFYFFNSSYKAQIYFKIAYAMDEKNPKGSIDAMRYYKKAINTYKAIDDVQGLIGAYIHLGLLHFKFGNVLQVERMVLKALALGKNDIPRPLQAKSYLLLAGTSAPKKAVEYIDKALEISRELELRPQMVKSYFLLARLHEYKAEFEKAEEQYLKALDLINDHPSTMYYVDMVSLYENLGELYAGDGETKKAIKYYDSALAHSFREDPKGIATARFMKILGDLYDEKREFAKACEFWRKSSEQYNFVSKLRPVNMSGVTVPDSCHNQITGSYGKKKRRKG